VEDKLQCKHCGIIRTGQDSHFYPTDCFEYTKRRLIDCEASNKNFEEYTLKGVAFRDKLQARIALLEKVVEYAKHLNDHRGFCKSLMHGDYPCDCGFQAALDALKEG
jgi:hypothetical protein